MREIRERMIWVTSDSHFGHANIIQLCARPFDGVEQMDAELTLAWNRVVSSGDIVYHLGDFTLGNVKMARKYFSKLNGSVYILCMEWHHDKRWIKQTDGGGYVSLYTKHDRILRISPTTVIKHDGEYVHLCHYPLREWDRKYHGSIHLHGHQHASSVAQCRLDDRMLNIGVDAAKILLGEYRPFSLDEAVWLAKNG